MTFQPGANVYTQGFGSRPENVEVPHIDVRAPATTDILYPVGKVWVDQTNNASYTLTSFSASGNTTTANWVTTGGGSGAVATLTGDSGTATPSGGNIKIAGTTNQITTAASGATVTLSLPTAVTVTTLHATTIDTNVAAAELSLNGTTISATGSNADVSLNLSTKGTGSIVYSQSSAGVDLNEQITNSDNTSGTSNAGLQLATGGASSGDPYVQFAISGVGASTMTMGLDNSDSDKWKISNSASLGTSDALTLTQAGALTTAAGITATTGDVAASSGNLSASGTVTGGTGVTATTGNVSATAGAVNAGTSMTATLGDITATNGNVVLNTIGNKLVIATGVNASVGTSDAMSGMPGAVIVPTTASSATAKIFYSRATVGGTMGNVSITAQDGTGFTLTSDANETSTFNWWIINA